MSKLRQRHFNAYFITRDEVWFSAKFTGPAYVKSSTKENAIFVDMAVLIRKKD